MSGFIDRLLDIFVLVLMLHILLFIAALWASVIWAALT